MKSTIIQIETVAICFIVMFVVLGLFSVFYWKAVDRWNRRKRD